MKIFSEQVKAMFKKDAAFKKKLLFKFLGIRKPKVKEVNIDRFVEGHMISYADAKEELLSGKKRTHWMWYIFPQIKGLGQSASSIFYAINDLYEARAYMNHELLGAHMLELCHILLDLDENNIKCVFPYPDDLKLWSSMTLFYEACPRYPEFKQILDRYYGGVEDESTLAIIDEINRQETLGVRA